MAEQRHTLDSKVLSAFFLAAMPFVAVGSFVIVNQARNLLRESVGTSLEQRAVETKLALESYVANQVVHLRLLAEEPDVASALARRGRAEPEGVQTGLEQGWAAGKDARLEADIVAGPLAARTRPLVQLRPAFRRVQLVDASGRLVASSTRGGRLFNAETAWFKALAAPEGA